MRLAVLCLLVAALLIAGCGSASHPQVASLSPSGASSDASAAANVSSNQGTPDPDGRPRATLDDTAAQFSALYDPYYACLRAHSYVDAPPSSAKATTILSDCEKRDPLPAWQFDPTNPQARAFVGKTVTCMLKRGYHARAELITNIKIQAPSWFVKYSPDNVNYAPKTQAAQAACQQQAGK